MLFSLILVCRNVKTMKKINFIRKFIETQQCRKLFYQASSVISETDLLQGFSLQKNFISQIDESSIVNEVNKQLMRRKYNTGHWDGAIVLYRELEKNEWNRENTLIMDRFQRHVFDHPSSCLSATHVLDLHENGYIKPHIDSIQFCGELVCGISLLSDAVMRLQLDNDNYVNVHLPRLSLYILSHNIRYKYTHEILPNPSVILDKSVFRTRRITLMKRSLPNK